VNINDKIQAASHSGALLEVVKINENFIVEKTIRESIVRNKVAVMKQKKFIKLITSTYDVIAIPVSHISEDKERLFIQMPYIEGIGGDVISNKGNKIIAKNIKIALNSYLLDAVAKSTTQKISKSVILEKVDEIERKTVSKIEALVSLKSAITFIRKLCTKDLFLPVGPCHGDFTLSNMKITQENELYIFDFLDSYIESPLQDAAKLNQDMLYGWSFRKEKASLKLKGQLFCEFAYPDFIDSLVNLYPYEMKLLDIMTLLRIAPYINDSDKVTIDWFNYSVSKILQK